MGPGGENRRVSGYGVRAASAGGQLVITFLVGFLGGHWLDAKLHTTPWLTAIGVLLGFGLGLLLAYRTLIEP